VPHEASRHDRDGDARLLVDGLEPLTEVLLDVPVQDGQVGLAGPGVAQAGPVQIGVLGRVFVRGLHGIPADLVPRSAAVSDALHQGSLHWTCAIVQR
jgi:hypothetical protein